MLPYFNRSPYDLAEQHEEHNLDFPSMKTHHLHRGRRRSVYILLGVIATLSLWLFNGHLFSRRLDVPHYPLPVEIPNIAHFVRQLDRNKDGTPKPLHFEFRHFLAYYSAHHYLKPDSINIWSDMTPEMISQAAIHGDIFTKAVLRIPHLKFHHVEMPNVTSTGFPIVAYAHKSDFIRTRVMADLGGQYFDDDAWVIRDLAPLRKAGFENVFGKEWGDDLCQAMWMATPNNTLMRAFERLQETEFNGEWVKASNILISNLVYDITGLGHNRHALVLERNAFFAGQWDMGDAGLPMFYKVHGEDDGIPDYGPPPQTVDDLVNNYDFIRNKGWRKDWRNSYVIHGFSNAVRDLKAMWMFEPYGGFTPAYVLARQSNIARALYPALQHAIETGFLPSEEFVSSV
jgi:hypothetical protein